MSDDLKRRSAIRTLMKDAAKEMGFAVSDIRSELIDRGWFEREPATEKKEPFESHFGLLSEREHEAAGPQDFSREKDDLYGREAERDRDEPSEKDLDR
jgi:hypothetical protein